MFTCTNKNKARILKKTRSQPGHWSPDNAASVSRQPFLHVPEPTSESNERAEQASGNILLYRPSSERPTPLNPQVWPWIISLGNPRGRAELSREVKKREAGFCSRKKKKGEEEEELLSFYPAHVCSMIWTTFLQLVPFCERWISKMDPCESDYNTRRTLGGGEKDLTLTRGSFHLIIPLAKCLSSICVTLPACSTSSNCMLIRKAPL